MTIASEVIRLPRVAHNSPDPPANGRPTDASAFEFRWERSDAGARAYAQTLLDTSSEFDAATFEFHRYLSDQVAPLMVVDEFGILLKSAPGAVAAAAIRWVKDSAQPASDPDLADQILHTVRKIVMMGEFDLVPRPALGAFLNDYCQEILGNCPQTERGRLIGSLIEFGRSLTAPGALLEYSPVAVPIQGAAARRMAVFMDQLEAEAPGERRDEVASEFMTAAAMGASTREELDATLAVLRGVGIDPATENVLKSIARSLPGWGALDVLDQGLAAPPGERLGAMRQIVALGEDEEEIAKRFREMVHAAIAQFNEGNVGRSQSVLVLAQQMATEQRVKPAYVENLRNASDYLDMDRLKAAAEQPESLPALRTLMAFFHALSPDGLLAALRREGDDNRKRDISSLIEIHGAEGRAKALELLDAPDAAGDAPFASSALRLLRRIPRPAEGSADREVDIVLKHATKGTDAQVASQAIYFLGQTRGDRAERALVGMLRMYESALARPEALPATVSKEDIFLLLDRTCGALARCGSPRCLRSLVDHGMKSAPTLGDCAKRLGEGSHADFSRHAELLKRLIEGLRAELPRAVMGLKFKKETGRTASFVRALSGTPNPEVKALFQEIVKKYGDEEYGMLAKEALEAFTSRSRPQEPAAASTFSGDLSFFGLPMLLQTLAQGTMTGLLTLINGAGETAAKLWLLGGRLQQASLGRLSQETALYELLIRPFPGTFAFVHRTDGPEGGVMDPPRELMSLIFEGVRRHDEWKRAAALIGDDVRFAETGADRTVATHEPAAFVEEVWAIASKGSTARSCEAAIAADSFRIRTLLASWVEIEALKLG